MARVAVALAFLAILLANAELSRCSKSSWGWFKIHEPGDGGPTRFNNFGDWLLIDDLYFHINRFVILEDVNHSSAMCNSHPEKGLGLHTPVSCLAVNSANQFLQNIIIQWIDGLSLWIDFPDVKRIDNMGYWFEIAGQIRGHLSSAIDKAKMKGDSVKPFKHIIIHNVIKFEVDRYPWILELLKIAVEPVEQHFKGNNLKLWFFHDIAKDFELWVGIERAIKFNKITSKLRENDDHNIFSSISVAQSFREAVWKAKKVVLSPPRDITLLLTIDDAGLSNPKEVLRVLHDYKTRMFADYLFVRPYSPTLGNSLTSMVKRMVQTKVFIARHGSLLGCSMFMQPGSFVLELMPYRYDGLNTFSLYRQLTRSLGDVYHLTLPSTDTKSVIFQSEEDEKYAKWLPGECYAGDCLDAHEVAGLNVSIASLKSLFVAVQDLETGKSPYDSGTFREYTLAPKRSPRKQANAGVWYEDEE